MSTRASTAAIGAFVLGALVIAAIGLAVFFGEGWGKNRFRAVMVFEGNVAGIDVGTPVEFRGVRIGEVRRIRSIYDTASRTSRFAVYTLLTGAIEIDWTKTKSAAEQREWLEVMVEEGLRARLETKSFVTGQQRVMLDFFPDTKAVLVNPEPGMTEIPTLRSTSEELYAELREIPFREIVLEVRKLLQSLQRVVEAPDGTPGPLPAVLADVSRLTRGVEEKLPVLSRELAQTAAASRSALADARALMTETQSAVNEARRAVGAAEEALRTVNRRVDSGGAAMEGAAGSIADAGQQVRALALRVEQSLARLDRTMARVEHTFSEDSAVGAVFTDTMREVGSAAHSLRSAAELLQRRPEALLRGRGDDAPRGGDTP